jgi:hypothetical protein
MSSFTVANTNVRLGPGTYLALKEMADKSGLNIGTCANLLVVASLIGADKNLSQFTPQTQKAMIADMLSAFSEIFKLASLETVKNTSLIDLYQALLGKEKT